MTIEQIIHQVKKNNPQAKIETIQSAYDFALSAHGTQQRKTGELYIQHPLHTAFILAQMKADVPTIVAGMMHDVPEDTGTTLKDVRQKFGDEIASLVEGVTKLSKVRYRGVERYRESLRKMFLAMTDDLRVILIKFADRLHNLRTLEGVEPKKRLRIAKETMEIYAPIAGLLGIWRLKWQMEDICFKYLYPEEYKTIEYRYEIERKVELNQYIQKVKTIVSDKLTAVGIEHKIEGRFKHLYSIWQKMMDKDRKFDEIYDVFALRIIVPTVADCYNTLGIIHTIWKPNYNRFKDYIAVPKPNGYRSLHTTVFGPEGKATEFQIRTEEMHQESLYGISAHLHYKQHRKNDTKTMRWMQEVLDAQRENEDTQDFIQQIKINVFQDRIFVFTPKGDVYDLPRNSTPIDFAYAVHTDIGNKCVAALINNKMSKLNQELKNGDLVEIVIDKNRKGPSYEWLNFVTTKKARDKIKQYAKRFSLARIRKMMPKLPK
ncbi:MAG: RelA/SpoT family protein [bacterium]